MPTVRLTEKTIARLPAPDPSGKQALHWCDTLKGFGVLCSGTTGAKSYIVQHALPDGTRRRVTIARTNVLSLDAAKVEAKKVLATFYSGKDPKSLGKGNATLRTTLADFLVARTNLKDRSREFYQENINRHLTAWLDVPLRNVSREMVLERLHKIAKDVKAKNRYSGNAAANAAFRAFRAVYNFEADRAPEDNPLPRNPVRLQKSWLPVKARTRAVHSGDMKKFYKAVCGLDSPVAVDYFKLVTFTGLRRREAAGLQWQHVDFEQKIIRLPAEMTKATRSLPLPMSDFIFDVLKARREATGDTKWVFPANSKSGHFEEPKSFLDDIAAASGVRISVHDLRRGFITTAESCDISVLALKALVNHALGNSVTESYVQMDVERLREPMQKVTDRLKELCGIG